MFSFIIISSYSFHTDPIPGWSVDLRWNIHSSRSARIRSSIERPTDREVLPFYWDALEGNLQHLLKPLKAAHRLPYHLKTKRLGGIQGQLTTSGSQSMSCYQGFAHRAVGVIHHQGLPRPHLLWVPPYTSSAFSHLWEPVFLVTPLITLLCYDFCKLSSTLLDL